ncbi:MAG: FGGY family carbohydrate kinase [Saprospiraceae bacterium]|nr:FGGY family carbohydrate kinase [Saprospiraceae bacterium]
MYLLGYDIGSSSVKAALIDAVTGVTLQTVQFPSHEMNIIASQPDWAEQHPDDWWEACCMATRQLMASTNFHAADIAAIGIAYQMHGLVMLDKGGKVLRPAIIWCDSRAVGQGEKAFQMLGTQFCLEHYLNSPGNFTASKLRWVKEHEPDIFEKTQHFMLPGDYIAYRMTGEICTTIGGLSEGILWDFNAKKPASTLLDYYDIPESMLPPVVDVFSRQGELHPKAAAALGLQPGIPVGYRAGDQPNNAFSLNVLRSGEVAATGGTSGVVYAVSETPVYDIKQRVNSFSHVNYRPSQPFTGVLLCINGAGSAYRWLRENTGALYTYAQMEAMAGTVAPGAEGLCILPFGNGAERMLEHRNTGAIVSGLNFNRHNQAHLYRAALEGIAFSFVWGVNVMRNMGISISKMRVGGGNLFESAIFSSTISTLLNIEIEIYDTNGAAGAARAAGVAVGLYTNPEEAAGCLLNVLQKQEPQSADSPALEAAYVRWCNYLNKG